MLQSINGSAVSTFIEMVMFTEGDKKMYI